MKVSPILICRTKYNDFNSSGRPFCAPTDVSEETIYRLQCIVDGNAIMFCHHCDLVLTDEKHIILGRVISIGELEIDDIDLSLDKEVGGRIPWGFIGGAMSIEDYRVHNRIEYLSADFYSEAYKEYLYDPHWLDGENSHDEQYIYPYVDKALESLPNSSTEMDYDFYSNPLQCNKNNLSLLLFVLSEILKGKHLSFCSNCEFKAADLIFEGILDFATVSEGNLLSQNRLLEEKQRRKQEGDDGSENSENSDSSDNLTKGEASHDEEGKEGDYKKLFSFHRLEVGVMKTMDANSIVISINKKQ